LKIRKHGTLEVGVAIALILPAVVNAVGVVVVKMKHNICVPVAGGVTVTTAVVPVISVRNVAGAIVAAEAIVAGPIITLDCTVLNCWKFSSIATGIGLSP
jgi:hypothetical protein